MLRIGLTIDDLLLYDGSFNDISIDTSNNKENLVFIPGSDTLIGYHGVRDARTVCRI